jgi:cytochrome c oxidase subunit IV
MTVTRAWIILVGLSALSTLAAASGIEGRWLAAAVLVLAGVKARVILNHYLHLAQAPEIARGFSLVLGLVIALMIGLAILPSA